MKKIFLIIYWQHQASFRIDHGEFPTRREETDIRQFIYGLSTAAYICYATATNGILPGFVLKTVMSIGAFVTFPFKAA